MKAAYRADDIEVLSGLDPVRRRPGMFTDTARPNHLAHEVIDNSVDEALAEKCKRIDVTLHEDGSLAVEDDGRGMPVDIHEETGLSGVELILTRLHAGAKFSRGQYRYSGGLLAGSEAFLQGPLPCAVIEACAARQGPALPRP